MDCKGGSPKSRWQRPLEKKLIVAAVGRRVTLSQLIVAHTLKWPSGLVCLATCIKIKKNNSNEC